MTNYEAHKEEIEKFLLEHGHVDFGITHDGKLMRCCYNDCKCCIFCAVYGCQYERMEWLNAEAESEEMRLAKSLKLGDIVECWDDDEDSIRMCYYGGLSDVDRYPFRVYGFRKNMGDKQVCDHFKHIRRPKPFESEESEEN